MMKQRENWVFEFEKDIEKLENRCDNFFLKKKKKTRLKGNMKSHF